MSSTRKHYKYEYLTSRWGGMKLRKEMEPRIESWLSGFSEEEQKLMLDLLSNFHYYSEKRMNEKVEELYKEFVESYTGNPADVIFTKIIKEQGASFSDIFSSAFWFQNNLYDYMEPNILSLLEEGSVPGTLVIVDDYSGTGKTFIKTIDKFIEKNRNIITTYLYFLTLHITQRAIKQIEEYSKEIGVQIKIISLEISDEAFKSGYLFEEGQAFKHKKYYSDICTRHSINEKFVFGFEDVASLVAFYYNTPNNTLGLFWHDLTDFIALFPRHKKEQTSLKQMQKDAQDRKNRREQIVIFGIDDARLAAIMAYCIANGTNVSLANMKHDFGLTPEQLDSILEEMIKKEYIYVENGTIIPTEKLKSHMFVSRLKRYKKSFYHNDNGTDTSTFNTHDEYIPVNFK